MKKIILLASVIATTAGIITYLVRKKKRKQLSSGNAIPAKRSHHRTEVFSRSKEHSLGHIL